MANASPLIEDILNGLDLIEALYDRIRIIDPIEKVVLGQQDYGSLKSEPVPITCHDFWHKNAICTNCISARAFQEKKSLIKLEFSGERIYMLTALPIYLSDRVLVVELLKEITHTSIIEDLQINTTMNLSEMLTTKNDLIVTDDLTQIYNKRYLLDHLSFEIQHSKNTLAPLSVIMLDIDRFKSINDQYGHLAGDFILREFSKILSSNIRKDKDWVARYGGDEFFICLPDTEYSLAQSIVHRIHDQFSSKSFMYDVYSIPITASFGIYTIHGEDISVPKLIQHADENLYRAKHHKCNPCCNHCR